MDILRLTYRFFLTCLVAASVSCSKGSFDSGIQEVDVPVKFNPLVNMGMKSNSLIDDGDELQSYSISLFANAVKDGIKYPVFRNERLYYGDEGWDYASTQYWIRSASYSFAAFAPYAVADGLTVAGKTLSNGTVSVSGNNSEPVLTITDYDTGCDVEDAKSEDLLVAHYTRDNSLMNDYSPVPLTFGHILSCIRFSIRNTTNEDITKVSEIKLSGLKYKGSITLSTTSLSVSVNEQTGSFQSSERISAGTQTPFLPKGMQVTDYKPLFDCEYLTLFPQQLFGNEDIVLSFKVHYGDADASGSPYTLNLGNVDTVRKWVEGNKYDYTISITSQDVLFQVVEVPWIEHDVEL